MKRSPLRKKPYTLRKIGKSDSARTKARIQKLLTELVRLRDGGCIMRHYPATGQCSGFTAADHIISRQISATYADSRNVIALCQRHHIYWKPTNPTLYARFVEQHIGKKTYSYLFLAQQNSPRYRYTEADWLKAELMLHVEIQALQTNAA